MCSFSELRMAPLNRQASMLASGIFSTSAYLASMADRPEYDIGCFGKLEYLIADSQGGYFAAAAGGSPVKGDLSLGNFRLLFLFKRA